ncbi:CBS domain-containing protein [Gammaproteobacteria bacterium]|nr:CBS domain-containing protein [Gammaproteobacteria bacterium]
MIVSHILKSKGRQVYTVSKETNISVVSSLLATKKIGAIVIISKNRSVEGIVSERDIVRGLSNYGAKVLDMPVKDLMTKNVITRGVESQIDELRREMTRSRIRHLPILDDGKLVGLISIGDVVKNRVEELQAEGDMLREYISSG